MSVISALKEKLTNRKAERTLDYAALVDDEARGISHDPEEAEAILTDAGKTLEDFTADLEIKRQRIAWRKEFDEGKSITAKASEAEQEQAELREKRDKEIEAIRAKYQQRDFELQHIQDNASQIFAQSRQALRRLNETAPAEVLEAEEKVKAEITEHQQRLELMRDRVQMAKGNVTILEDQISKTPKGSSVLERYNTELTEAKRKYAEECQHWESMQRTREELTAEMNEIQARKLQP